MKTQNNSAGPDDEGTARTLSVMNLIAGIYLFISSWLYGAASNSGAMWNSIVFGVAVMLMAIVHLSAIQQSWASWFNCIFGLWIMISSWAYSFSQNVGMSWSCMITGFVVFIAAIWTATISPRILTR